MRKLNSLVVFISFKTKMNAINFTQETNLKIALISEKLAINLKIQY